MYEMASFSVGVNERGAIREKKSVLCIFEAKKEKGECLIMPNKKIPQARPSKEIYGRDRGEAENRSKERTKSCYKFPLRRF